MLKQLFSSIARPANHQSQTSLSKEYINYAGYAYPGNHTFRIANGRLIPKRQLARRYNRVRTLYPATVTSLAEVSSSKGFFVFAASQYPGCKRTLGIDVNPYDIKFCNDLKTHLSDSRSQFEFLRLHELAERIHEFGGPLQTILVQNAYQYLYFGSEPFPDRYLDHDLIFKCLRSICSERVIFNNRINLEDVQKSWCVDEAGDKRNDYTEEKIYEAASKYFHVVKHAPLGGYALWTLDVKG